LSYQIMARIKSGEVTMKPRWYFIMGSAFLMAGLAGLTLLSTFLINVTIFLLRRHGPMGQRRLELMLADFPWYIPLIAIFSLMAGIYLLRKYDFSYRKNSLSIIFGFIITVMVTAFIVDWFGFNEDWSQRGPMRRFYQQVEPGWGGRLRD